MTDSEIKSIRVENIYPHPENPRKDLGNIEEMVESIKKNGIMQNLTVVPIDAWDSEPARQWDAGKLSTKSDFFALIGHRRLAAAKKAGLQEVPCKIVSNISRREQVSIMLEENMQRNDLTIWEQAQGFQMMLSLGETEDSIAEKTGFSKQTIKHRLNIAKLDQTELKKKEQDDCFQLTLKDLYELEKVEDIATRNKILRESRSSSDIRWKATNAAVEAKRNKTAKTVIKKLKEKGVQAAPKKAENEIYSNKWDIVKRISLDEEIPSEIKYKAKKTDILYYIKYYREVLIIKKAEKKPETKQDIKRKDVERRKKQLKAKVKELENRRKEFISLIVSGKIPEFKESIDVYRKLWSAIVEIGSYLNMTNMKRFFTGKAEWDCTQEEKAEATEKVKSCSVLNQMVIQLNYAMDNVGDLYDWQGRFDKASADKLLNAYRLLQQYGWCFENDEEQLLDGTHELYTKDER